MPTSTPINPVRHSLLLGGALGAAAAAYLWFVFFPQQTAIAALREELSQKQDYLGQSDLNRIALDRELARLEETSAFVDRWQDALPRANAMSPVLADINRLVRESGLEVSSFRPLAPEPLDRLERVELQLGCHGELAAVGKLVALLEGVEYPLWVDSLEVRRMGETAGVVQCELRLAIFAARSGFSD